jgi:hypothetical protein
MSERIEIFELFVTEHLPRFISGPGGDYMYFCANTECMDCIVHRTVDIEGCGVTQEVFNELKEKYPEYMI